MSYLNQFKLPDGINDPNAMSTSTPAMYTQAEVEALTQNAVAQANLQNRTAQAQGVDYGASARAAAGADMQLAGAGMQASGGASVLGGAFDIYQGIRNLRDAKPMVERYQGELDELKANQPSLGTPSAYYEMAKNAYDARLMQMRVDDINRGLANTTAAATQFGSRGLGALAGATQSANRAQQEEVLRQQQMQTAAMGELAGAQQQAQQLQLQQNQFNQNMTFEQLSMANQQMAAAQEQIGAGVGAVAGGVVNYGLGGDVMGMAAQMMEEGGKVQKTPGKFSHDENEMAVVTEEGEDTGIRVTGGEYVLNPDQSKTIKKLVEAGDKDALMKFMDDLLDEPQFA